MFCTIFEAERGFYWHNFSKPKLYKFVRPPTSTKDELKKKELRRVLEQVNDQLASYNFAE